MAHAASFASQLVPTLEFTLGEGVTHRDFGTANKASGRQFRLKYAS